MYVSRTDIQSDSFKDTGSPSIVLCISWVFERPMKIASGVTESTGRSVPSCSRSRGTAATDGAFAAGKYLLGRFVPRFRLWNAILRSRLQDCS